MSKHRISTCCLALSVSLLVACADDARSRGPVVTGLSHREISIGESLYVTGQGFISPELGHSELVFRGVYEWTDDDGRVVREEVAPVRLAPIYDGAADTVGEVGVARVEVGDQLLRWNRFGPFAVPFGGRGNHPGSFVGEVVVENHRDGGGVSPSKPLAVTIEVKPSIVLHRLEPVTSFDEAGAPITAPCGAPALRILPGLAYVMEAEAIGIRADTFSWSISGANGSDGLATFTHAADGARSTLGDGSHGDVVVFDPLPDGVDVVVATIQVRAFAADGSFVETVLPVDIVRPMQFIYDGNRELGEYYEPVVVNGPIVGGIGTVVTYSESHAEARQHGVSVNITRSVATQRGTASTDTWSNAVGVTETVSATEQNGLQTSEGTSSGETYGESWSSGSSTSTNVSSSNGSSWGWSLVEGQSQDQYQENVDSLGSATSGVLVTEVGGEASIPGIAGVSGKVGSESGVENTVGREVKVGGRTGARTDRGQSVGGSASTTTGYGSTTTDSRSRQVGGSYAVNQQQSINQTTSETEATAESLVYTVGGSDSVTENFTQGESESWGETWVSTSTDTTLLAFSGKVPNGRCAVIYRQTVRHVRTATVVQHDLCGVREPMGELHFNEWSWSPNIAIGDDCTTSLPPSTQPKAQCFVACD